MTAFVLSLRSFPWANRISFFFYFTTLFSGGLVPWYILCVQYLKFKENPLIALVLPSLLNVFHLMVMKSFLKATIQDSVVESAKIDGASYFRIFIQIILPLSKPALATIGLFIALGYWNDWFLAFLFVTKEEYFPMQYYLYRMINTADALLQLAARSNISIGKLPKESSKMAMAVIAVGPILFLYPYVQKYFVKGLTIGAVKG
jgi:putative aldouronate transport system permease protein